MRVDIDDLTKEVAKISWFHTIDLGHGVVTAGSDNSPARLRKLGLPEDLRGASVLDVGAWDGFFSFEAERRGASRVLATDSFCWGGGGPGAKAGFELARRALNSKVEDMNIDVLDLSAEKVGVFDLVLFLGVLYHMRHPLLALEKVFSVTRKQLILETHVDMLWTKRPAAAFYPDAELHNDPTNWWGPNLAAVDGMLRAVGFREVKLVSRYHSRAYMLGAAAYLRVFRNMPFFQTLQQNRAVFHAWK
jgi:tRNA (mo5U34)-methyltransferase